MISSKQGNRRHSLRKTVWLLSVCFILVMAFFGFLESRWGEWFLDATKQANSQQEDVVKQEPQDSDGKPDAEQQSVLQEVGTVPYLEEVYLDHTEDGKLIVSATADIGTAKTNDKKSLAREIVLQFNQAVYSLHMPIAGSMINITDNNRLVAGAALGENQQKGWVQTTATGAAAATQFVQFLQKNQHESEDILNNTWFYEED
ncbi:hypothetical protein DNHGIG_30900 [Collibacillus ludicampi]|uniref:Uncharacterized protein n=1 Tax=Collibacillus ludicampi TaxID=2771369 RepID=A0AAV4LIE5_9BACL|nr:hypothetical protein [Collibacillus ludicampi]GIM47541.1 hypothetical protein DNHGIG_30900 [Collibacillus ludicampi]